MVCEHLEGHIGMEKHSPKSRVMGHPQQGEPEERESFIHNNGDPVLLQKNAAVRSKFLVGFLALK